MATVEVLARTHSSARTEHLDRLLHQHWGQALLLTPTHQFARRRMEELLLNGDVPGAWGAPVLTLQSFAEAILQKADPEAVRLNDLERRLMLQGALARLRTAGKLEGAAPESETDGFLNHLLRVFENLKQAAVEPAEFAERVDRRKHPGTLDRLVALAYQAYQDALIENHAYDLIGVYWQVRRILEEGGAVPLLNGVDLLAFDGFDDFTESEFQLIATLGKRVGRLVFSMLADSDPNATDLYRLQRQTMDRLEKAFNVSTSSVASLLPASFSEYASAYLLWRGEAPSRDGLRPNLEVVPCAGVTEEVETIGRAIKTLILEGVSPVEIAVVYHDLGQVWASLRSMAREFQIPLRLYGEEQLAASSIAAFVLDALDASAAWRHGEIVELLVSPWMNGDGLDESLAGALPVLCRLAGIVTGHSQWLRQLRRLREALKHESGEGDEDIPRFKRRNPCAVQALDATIARVERLATALSAIPAEASLPAFGRATAAFIDALDLRAAIQACPSEPVRARETAALESFQEVLGRLSTGPFAGNGAVPRAHFARFLRQACGTQGFRVTPTLREKHGVRCLTMASLRGLRFRYVFFGGVNEGVIPSPPSVNAVYSEDDVRELRDAGIPLEPWEVRSEREFAGFHHVLQAPSDRIWILWRTATPDGKPLLRSPFLNDLLRLFPDEPIERAPLRAGQYYPALAEAASTRDALNHIFATKSKVPQCLADRFAHVIRGADIEKRRYSPAAFDAFDGILSAEAHIERIAVKYGQKHVFSPTELEDYRTCPFKFFAGRLLRLTQIDTPETAFDRRELGIVVHRVLEEFHGHYKGIPVREIPAEEALSVMRELVDAAFGARKDARTPTPEGILAAERISTHARMNRYLIVEREEKDAWRPVHFEVLFGGDHGPFPALEVETEAGPLRMRGRIDRVDEGAEGFRVIDYKTGYPPSAEDVKQGISLQLVTYALALEHVIAPGSKCVEGALLRVGTSVSRRVCEKGRTTWEAAREGFFQGVVAALTGIRAAVFPPTPRPDVCAYCEARRVCRIDPSRIDRKQEQAG